ncbi:MAG: tripartite tricarboxylate transporter TctB family protein [Spirochaetia bacterium]|jgi:hypothetical protein|nr:tripartite tricarboxylate transporter TctB family protein [Spirochaetia bacterium]
MNKVFPVICIPLGILWILMGIVKYGVWVDHGPGGGLFPMVCGTMLVGFGIPLLFHEIKSKANLPLDKRAVIFVFVSIVTVSSIYFIGMVPALGIFIIVWLKFFEKKPIFKSVTIGTVMAAFLFILFRLLLKVPLPNGLLG